VLEDRINHASLPIFLCSFDLLASLGKLTSNPLLCRPGRPPHLAELAKIPRHPDKTHA
jgi:hypothetical protein